MRRYAIGLSGLILLTNTLGCSDDSKSEGSGVGGASVGTGGAALGGGGAPTTGGSTGTGGTGGGTGSGGSPQVETTTVCVTAAEDDEGTLTCPAGSVITDVEFASYGQPTGECEDLAIGTCHAADSEAIVADLCLGQNSCTVMADNETFGEPCSFVVKSLAVRAVCTENGAGGTGGSGGTGATGGSGGTGGSTGDPGEWNEGSELKAFPTAEGYGRLAKGGRGGRVMKVTNLNDSGPGSLREAVEATGPRTVVFDIGGTIRLESKLVIGGDNGELTIAGQTAPGKGIIVRDYTFGMTGGEDVILRFIRTRVGTSSGVTMDGMGQTASNNTIFDHCSISWTIDEGFSSRQAHNITLQRTLISECLNDAGHEIQQSPHGYAASINGDIGSFHKNLLAHCVGRNWSMAGSLKGGTPTLAIGRLDLRNNVVYNWQNRTTDGEIYQVNFVNNYYKPGPASTREYALAIEYYEIADNPPSYYISGNVMPGYFTANEVEKSYEIRETPPGDFLSDSPLWEPYVETLTAEEAYEDVLDDVGCNVPALDDHDKRIIEEVRNGTYTYSGSRTGLPGHIDNEADAGGHEEFPVVERPEGWDTDDDGMPNTWESAHGLNPNDPADGNATTLSEVGYTNLEMYLNELAGDLE